MIEILVSLFVLTVGLLGAASLQGVGVYNNHSAYLSTQANQLAYNMVDRIRANQAYIDADGDGQTDDYGYNYQNVADPQLHAACRESAGCTQEEMAENDVREWQDAVAANLPEGKGIVCVDSNPFDSSECDGVGNIYVVKVEWHDAKREETMSIATMFKPITTSP